MPIKPKTGGIHHIGLRCTDFNVTKKFYIDILGFQLVLDTPTVIGLMVGTVIVAFKQANAVAGKDFFTPFNIGLDHVALACESEEELERVAKELEDAGVQNTGIKTDEVLHKQYVAFKDPDKISWEFYMI